MEVLVKLSIPSNIYRFYEQASHHVAQCDPEQLMSDALSAYAGLLSPEIAREQREAKTQQE